MLRAMPLRWIWLVPPEIVATIVAGEPKSKVAASASDAPTR